MSVRVPVTAAVLSWVLDVTNADSDRLRTRFKVDEWMAGEARPTLRQLEQFAASAGVGLGYLLLPEPPQWELPVPDFREGFSTRRSPSADLIAVLSQSQRRQEWYRDYALNNGTSRLEFVGSAADADPIATAAMIRDALTFEVADRHGTWSDTRRHLLRRFEFLGGLSVATSMVDNNTHRLLDPDEFRGFSLIDDIAPLIFVNTHQTTNGQIFTIAHELAHVWRGTGGVSNEDPRNEAQSAIEIWCNEVASEILVPRAELAERYAEVASQTLADALDALAHDFRCGTLVVLQALHRTGAHRFPNFNDTYDAELQRLRNLESGAARGGGDHYNNQPFRIGERLSRAIVADALEGRTSIEEALRLMSMRSVSNFDEYARRLGAA